MEKKIIQNNTENPKKKPKNQKRYYSQELKNQKRKDKGFNDNIIFKRSTESLSNSIMSFYVSESYKGVK